MSQKSAAIIFSFGRLCRSPFPPRRLTCRIPRRFFSDKVIIENDEPPKQSTDPKYKPPFVIDFKNNRFTIYEIESGKNYVISAVLALLLTYCVFQVTWKWRNNSKLKFILCLWTALISGGILAYGVRSGRLAPRKINLMSSGQAIEVIGTFGWKGRVVPIKAITPKSFEEVTMMRMASLIYFEVGDKYFQIPSLRDPGVKCPDPEMLYAVTNCTEVDVGLSSQHPTINL